MQVSKKDISPPSSFFLSPTPTPSLPHSVLLRAAHPKHFKCFAKAEELPL